MSLALGWAHGRSEPTRNKTHADFAAFRGVSPVHEVSKILSLAGLVAKSVSSQSQLEKLTAKRVGISECTPYTTRISSQTTFRFNTWEMFPNRRVR